MKLRSLISCITIALLIISCSQSGNPEGFNANPEIITKNFNSWWNYNYRNIKLSEDYTALDTSSEIITKESFLTQLSTGKYVAFRLTTVDSLLKYKLHRLSPGLDKDIGIQMRQIGKDGYKRYKMEGTEISGFNFTDLNGIVYNEETTKGKIVVLKCWFIHCQACVEEMPALNEIVKQYQNRNDVLFISLAFDSKEQLKAFLLKTKFNYAVVPVSQEYLMDTLSINEFPTQFVINRSGKIVKVVTDYHDMASVLKRQLSK